MEINPPVLHTRLRKIARPLQNLSERRVATTVWQIVLKNNSLRFKAVFENFTLGKHRKIDCNKG